MGSTVTETVMGGGTWTLQLRDETPQWIRELIDPRTSLGGYASFAVTPSAMPAMPTLLPNDGQGWYSIASSAAYLGMVIAQDGDSLTGEGAASWMGRPTGIGARHLNGESSISSYSSMLSCLRAIVADGLTSSTVRTLRVDSPTNPTWWGPAATATGVSFFRRDATGGRTRRGDLGEFLRWVNSVYAALTAANPSYPWDPMRVVEWRITPYDDTRPYATSAGRTHWLLVDERRELYAPWLIAGTTIPAWVLDDGGVTDVGRRVIGGDVTASRSVDEWTSRWMTNLPGDAGFGDVTANHSRGHWSGEPIEMVGQRGEQVPSGSGVAITGNSIAGMRLLSQRESTKLTARVPGRTVPWMVPVGADLAVLSAKAAPYDEPASGFWQWRDAHPVPSSARRIVECRWGIPSGAGVWVVMHPVGGNPLVINLSPWFVPDDSPAELTLGQPRVSPDYLA